MITLFIFLQTTYSLLVSAYSQKSDVVIGTPVSGRIHEEIEPLIGFFINTLVLRNEMTNDVSFKSLLESNKQDLLDAFANQHVPFDWLVEELNPERSLSHSPVFQLWFVLQNYEGEQVDLHGLNVEPIVQESHTSLFDLALDITEKKDSLSLNWTYNTDLFNLKTIESFSQDYVLLLENICKNIDLPVKALTNLVSEASLERARLSKLNFRSQRTRKRVRKTETKTV